MDQKGFTLIELMITVAILAIILGIAVPSFSNILSNNRIDTVAQELHGAMQLARSEAVKRKEEIRVCRSNANHGGCANGTDWSSGWLMVRNTDGEVLKVWQTGQGLTINGPNQGVVFLGSGMASAMQGFSVSGPSCTSGEKRTLTVIRSGTTSLEKVIC